MIQALPQPVQAWWQTTDRLCVASSDNRPWPDPDEIHLLTDGEWCAGATTVQVRRMRGALQVSQLTEYDNPIEGAVPMLAQEHTFVPRPDLATTLQVTTYAAWSSEQTQVAPVAQRLSALVANSKEAS
jgi:hypothetical protein